MKEDKNLLLCEAKKKRAYQYRWLLGLTAFFAMVYVLWGHWGDWPFSKAGNLLLIVATVFLSRMVVRQRSKLYESDHVLKDIEEAYPDLKQRAFTAFDLLKTKSYQDLNTFEKRVVDEVIDHDQEHHWIKKHFDRPLQIHRLLYLMSVLVMVVLVKDIDMAKTPAPVSKIPVDLPVLEVTNSVNIMPGHTEVERFQNVMITAQFDREPHHKVALIHLVEGEERLFEMQKNLEDKICVYPIKRVEEQSAYRVQWQDAGGAFVSETFQIDVFDYPHLDNLEVVIQSPAHYSKAPRTLNNPKSVKAYAGSQITLRATLNVPEIKATLRLGEENLSFEQSEENPLHQELTFQLNTKHKAEIELEDSEGRENKFPHRLSFEVLKNKQPKIEVILPKRDIELTSISELPLKAKIKDDVGLMDWGVELYINGHEPIVISHQNSSSNKSPTIDTYVPLELYGLEEKDVLSYHFYASDIDMEQKERKIFSDLYYVQIRPFLREYSQKKAQPGESEPGVLKPFIGQQKEVVAALFKLKKMHHEGADVETLKEAKETISSSQMSIAEQLEKAIQGMSPDKVQLIQKLTQIQQYMVAASEAQAELVLPAKDDQINGLLSQGQAILSELFKLQSSMVTITQKQKSKSSNSSKEAQMRKKKKLKLAANPKYKEEQEQAQDQNALSQEMETLSALQELAQRQMDLNREMESLLAQLEKAEDKEEVLRKLKQLQDEQEQMQKEAQAMQDQMQNSESSEMQASKQDLEKSSEAMSKATEELKKENFDEALANAQKAQRELEKAEEEMRENSSQKLGEWMSQLSQQARQLERDLDTEKQSMQSLEREAAEQLSSAEERQERADSIRERGEELTGLLNKMESVTRSTEETQEALSDELYRALRQAKVDNIEQHLSEASELTEHGIYREAMNNLEEGREKVSELREAIDTATNRILGDESKALAQAQKLLQEFAETLEQEIQSSSDPSNTAMSASPSEKGEAADQASKEQRVAKASSEAQDSKGDSPSSSKESEQGGEAKSQDAKPGQELAQSDSKGEGQEKGAASKDQQNQPGEQPGQGAQAEQGSEQIAQQSSPSGQSAQGEQPSSPSGQGQASAQAQKGEGGQEQEPTQNGQGQQGSAQQNLAQADQKPQGRQRGGQGAGDSSGLFNTPGEVKEWLLDLRNVEQLMRDRDQRQSLSGIRDRLRDLYHEQKRHSKVPQAEVVQAQIYEPLMELLKEIDATQLELMREKEQIQVDRDPVPDEFKKMVQEYFLNLSESK